MLLPFPIELPPQGLIVGHTTSTTSRVWVRAEGGASLRVGERTLEVPTSAESDHTAVVEVTGLSPGSTTDIALGNLRGRIRTPPMASDRLCFAFVSCHLPFRRERGQIVVSKSVEMLETLRRVAVERDVAFVLHLGDQVYADPEKLEELDAWKAAARGADPLSLYREVHRAYFAVPHLRALHAEVPNIMIWDDGEICDTYGSRTIEHPFASAMVAAATRTFFDYQRAHGPERATDDTFAASFDVGPASFFVLDLRSRRDHAQRTLLGEPQWRALERWLHATDDKPIRFLASSVPLLHTSDSLIQRSTRALSALVPDVFHDRWSADAFHHELVRMFQLLRGRRVVVLGGDIHVGAAMDLLEPKIPQWVSSAITHEASLVHRLESEGMSRLAQIANEFPLTAHFHELRNNFGIVEVEGGRARFELWVRCDSGGAKKMYECFTPW